MGTKTVWFPTFCHLQNGKEYILKKVKVKVEFLYLVELFLGLSLLDGQTLGIYI